MDYPTEDRKMATNFPNRVRATRTESDPDAALEHRLVNYLHDRHVPGLETLRFEVQSGTVAVSGRIRTARAKRLCVACCRRVAGVIKLVDALDVEQRGKTNGNAGSQAPS